MTDFGETKRESMLGQLDRYQIKEKLGAGAMAAVFRAFDPHIDREIAIKVLRPELAKDEEHRARFLREARSAGGLSHDNIVQVFDVGESQNHPYMAMELLEGPTLKEIMHEEGALSVEDAINIAIDLARGLDSAHHAGVVHRDIKPGNVVRIASTGRIKITDFGIARQDSISDDDRTRAGTVLGTPRYMSPEQVRADRNIDGRSDLFSLGVILYQMLAGQTPFDGPTEAAVYVRITQEEPEPLNKLQPSLPSSLIKIVAKLLRKDPEQRYQTGAQLAGELKQVQRGLREERRRAHERKVVPLRLKWTAIAGAALALATLVGLWVVQHRQSQEMTALTYEYGSSLANFIARESMQPIQRGLWPAIEVYVEQTNERQDLISLTIIGPDGVVRGSTDAGSIGVGFVEPALPEPSATLGNTVVYEQTADDGRAAFLSVTPIVSRGQDVGEVRLTLPLEQVKSLSRQLTLSLAVLALIIVVIASLIAYFMARHLSAPIATLRESFDKLRNGFLSWRIDERRNDEFGLVFDSFNDLAAALQRRRRAAADDSLAELVDVPDAEAPAPVTSVPEAAVAPDADDAAPLDDDASIIDQEYEALVTQVRPRRPPPAVRDTPPPEPDPSPETEGGEKTVLRPRPASPRGDASD